MVTKQILQRRLQQRRSTGQTNFPNLPLAALDLLQFDAMSVDVSERRAKNISDVRKDRKPRQKQQHQASSFATADNLETRSGAKVVGAILDADFFFSDGGDSWGHFLLIFGFCCNVSSLFRLKGLESVLVPRPNDFQWPEEKMGWLQLQQLSPLPSQLRKSNSFLFYLDLTEYHQKKSIPECYDAQYEKIIIV